jgi:hypothetical protein
MKKFIKNTIGFSIFGLLVSTAIIYIFLLNSGLTFKDFPAPVFTNSFSFNQKMEFLRGRFSNAEVLSSGSSVTLNNLNSKIVTENFKTDSYVNAASWGLNIEQNFSLISILYDIYRPSKIVISSSILDFRNNNRDLESDLLYKWLKYPRFSSLYFYMRTLSLSYYYDNLKNVNKSRAENSYEYLGFDPHGGVYFKTDNFSIDKKRWEFGGLDLQFDEKQYSYLDSISDFCIENGIKLYFFQSPIRHGVFSSYSDEEKKILKQHVERIGTKLNSAGHIFIDVYDTEWPDSLFVDSTHMTGYGSTVYTAYCFKKASEISGRISE